MRYPHTSFRVEHKLHHRIGLRLDLARRERARAEEFGEDGAGDAEGGSRGLYEITALE
jgi:hypothetical protein